jgi:thiamine kinase-like enzyme
VFLTESNALLYLVRQGFAKREDAVRGAFSVQPLSRRNHNYAVRVANRHYFVKQAAKWNAASRSALDAEALLYRQSQTDERLIFLRGSIPECYAYDPGSSVLILEFLTQHNSLFDSGRRFDATNAEQIGEMMGQFQNRTSLPVLKQTYPAEIPWFFSLHKTHEDNLNDLSGCRRELVKTVRRHRDFAKALEPLKQLWRAECLMHGDCKLENWLVQQGKSIRLIDWECIGWGDPAWDAGTILQSYWNFHVRAPHIHSVDKIRPALHSFIHAYAKQCAIGEDELAARTIPFAGVRMLQSAFESLEKADSLTPNAARLLQAALNIMSRPEWAADYFLGIHWRTLPKN